MTDLTPPSEMAAKVIGLRYFRPTSPPDPEPVHEALGSVSSTSQFDIINLDDIEIGDDPIWMVEGLLPASGFGIVFGPPKSGKSFLLSDTLFHVAMGQPWAGRSVKQGAVLYITGEGVSGFKRRLVAMRGHYGVEGLRTPFGVITKAPDFGHRTEDAAELVATVRSWLESVGNPPLAAIAIDTLARAMKGADENTAKDMTVFVDNCGVLEQAFGCLVLGVHHAGKDVTKGSRGSNALDGAVDVMWSVEKGEAAHTAAIHYMKDGEEGLSWQFRLVPYLLREATETQAAVSTCIVDIVQEPASVKRAETGRNRKLPVMASRLFDIIKEAVSEAGSNLPGDPIVPHDLRSISRQILKSYTETRGWVDPERSPDSIRAQLNTNLNTLADKKLIGLTKEHLWLLGEPR